MAFKKDRSMVIMMVLVAVVGLHGCQIGTSSYRGKIVDEENRIQLSDVGFQTGSWITRDVVVAYEAEGRGGQLAISGSVAFTDHLTNGYVDIMVALRLNFYDADGKVIAGSPVDLPRYSLYHPVLKFNERIPIPDTARGFAFSYNGEARDGSDGGRDKDAKDHSGSFVWKFWKVP